MKSFIHRPALAVALVFLALLAALLWIALSPFAGRLDTFTERAPLAHASGDLGTITGYAWSDNLGWVSFSGSNYNVAVQSDGTLYGYAWANPSDDPDGTNNIGWISFNAADTAYCSTNDGGGGAAKLTGTTITGWARVCSEQSDSGDCSGSSLVGSDGWDGCISLSGSGYGVTLPSGSIIAGKLDGYAWADTTAGGWLSLNCDTGGPTQNNICATSNYAVTFNNIGSGPTPTLAITSFIASERVRAGNTATLQYIVTNPPASCTVTGQTATTTIFSTTVSPVDGVQGTVSPSPVVYANTLFTLTCSSVSRTVTVGVTPTIIEK